MKNYYDILGIPIFEDNQDAILSAYKNGIENLRRKIVDDPTESKNLVEFNEAFLVLSDIELKKLYDYSLTSHNESSELSVGINRKRERAKQFVEGKLGQIPKKQKKNVWPAILCGLFLLSGLGTILRTCSQAIMDNRSAPSTQLTSFVTPADWERHSISGAFTISIPPTMEQREDLSDYNATAVFQQKGLSENSKASQDTYCRVLVQYDKFGDGEVERHNETSHITQDDKESFRNLSDIEIEPWHYVEPPTFQWVDIDGTKAIEASYSRSGEDGPVNCKMYLLPNYNEMAKIIIAYRTKDSNKWATDMSNVIKTFRWNNPR